MRKIRGWLDFVSAFPHRGRSPSDGFVHGGVQSDPTTVDVYFGINVSVDVRPVRSKSRQCETHGMTGRKEHRSQKNGHVVAVAGLELQHPARRVQQFDTK